MDQLMSLTGPAVVETALPRQSLTKSIFLHLLPALVTFPVVFMFVPLFEAAGIPLGLIMLVIVPPVTCLFHLGFLFYVARRETGTFSLERTVLYREPIPLWQHIAFVPLLIFIMLLVVTLFSPLDQFLKARVFYWIPGWLSGVPDFGGNETYRLIGLISFLIFGALIGPVVQEMYFRGYLLPRLAWLKGWGVVLNALLFSVMHLTSPQQWLSAGMGILPMVYLVNRKRNIYLGIFAHCLLNIPSVLVMTGYLQPPQF